MKDCLLIVLFFIAAFQALAETKALPLDIKIPETPVGVPKPPEKTYPHKRFEWGMGLAYINADHYRGSDQGKTWFFPWPYFYYSGPTVEAEPSYVRGTLYRSNRFSFKLSLNLGLSVESEDNSAREGMPNLDYTFEIGPMFIFNLWKSKSRNVFLNFEIPIRQVYSSDLTYLRPIGLFTVPYLNLIMLPQERTLHFGVEFSLNPMFADNRFHEYFYSVAPQFATPIRPQYKAHGGYSGFQTTIILTKRKGDIVFVPFLRWDQLKGAVFEDSPLVKRQNYLMAGIGTFFLFGP